MLKINQLENEVRVFRAKHRLSQRDLADQVGVRRETISSLENGKYNPSLLLALTIAEVFGVSISEVFWVKDHE